LSLRHWLPLFFLACGPVETQAPQAVAWDRGLPDLSAQAAPGDFHWARSIVHLHSPHSHDACDGAHDDNEPIDDCLADFREAICATRLDAVFVTDHPNYASYETISSLLWLQEGDELLEQNGLPIANRMACENGHRPVLVPGFEDQLMPVGIERHHSEDIQARHDLYNEMDPDTVQALSDMGAVVLVAHTEQRTVEALAPLAEAGLAGVEMFNLHAMVDPKIRPQFLGLDATEWLTAAKPFTSLEGDAEPDLMFLAFYQEQFVSTAIWDGLSALGPTVGVAGTDAHQNVLNWLLRDGERLDSYRRMIRWFSNWLLVTDQSPEAHKKALAAGRNFAVFEILGTPQDFDVYATVDGQRVEIGSDVSVGAELHIQCPRLSAESPQSLDRPEITARVLKDGQRVAEGCDSIVLDAPGVYRVVFEMTPHHLMGFLGESGEDFRRPIPWIYANPIRVGSQK
jgi:hypothetical protein